MALSSSLIRRSIMEQINDLLECRKAKNKTGYHIYDITNKTRDTVDRINGLERPKPNEGYALKNDVSMILQSSPSLWDTSPVRCG